MSQYASNTPISRPVTGLGIDVDCDLNGIGWSNKWGFCFPDGADEQVEPIKLPPPKRDSF